MTKGKNYDQYNFIFVKHTQSCLKNISVVTVIISVLLDHEQLPIFLFGFICIFQIAYKEPKLFLEIEKANAIFNILIIDNLETIKFYVEGSNSLTT